MTIHTVPEQDNKKLGELIAEIKVAMFTTVDKAGRLHCRPMATVQQDFQGDLWFFSKASSFRTEEIKSDPRVQLSYVSTTGHTYAALSGRGEVSQDRQKMAELWSPLYRAWFPMGVDEPDMALIRVTVEEAEYWDAPTNRVVKLLGYIKALATGVAAEDTGHHLVIAPKSVEEPKHLPPSPELQAKIDEARWVGEGGNPAPRAVKPAPAKSNEQAKPERQVHEAKPPRNPMPSANEKKAHRSH
jgi:general stress protein 26